MVALVFYLASVFLFYLFNGVHSAAFPRGFGSSEPLERSRLLGKGSHLYGNRQPLHALQSPWKAHAVRQAQPRAQIKTQQKPQTSSVVVSGNARARPILASQMSQYRPRSYAFNKLPQERPLSQISRPTQYGRKRRPTLMQTPKVYSQPGPLSTQTNSQAMPRSFEFSVKVPFAGSGNDGTTKGSPTASGAGDHGSNFRPSSVQIQTSFNKPFGSQKGSPQSAGSPVDPSMLNYQLQLEVPIPSRSESKRTLSSPGITFGTSHGASQKGQTKPMHEALHTISNPPKSHSGFNPVNSSPYSFPTAKLQPEILPRYPNENQFPPHRPNKVNYYSPYPGNILPGSAPYILPEPIYIPQGHTTGLTKSVTQMTEGNPINAFQPVHHGYLYSLAPSQHQAVSSPIWNPGTMNQGKDYAAKVYSQQTHSKPPTPASSSYGYGAAQNEQRLPGHFSAVKQQAPSRISYTVPGQINDKNLFTKTVEPDFSWHSGSASTGYGNYVPIQTPSRGSALVPQKQISKDRWQTAALSKGSTAERNAMYNYDQYNRLNYINSVKAQPHINFRTPSQMSPNLSPSYSTSNKHYYPSEGFEGSFQKQKIQVYPPQEVSSVANWKNPQRFSSWQQTSPTFSNKGPALDQYEAVPLDIGSRLLVDRLRYYPHSQDSHIQSFIPPNLNRHVEMNGNVDPVYRQPGYKLVKQSYSQKPAYQNHPRVVAGFEVIPDMESYGYSSGGRESMTHPEYKSNIGEDDPWRSLHLDVLRGYKPSLIKDHLQRFHPLPSSTFIH